MFIGIWKDHRNLKGDRPQQILKKSSSAISSRPRCLNPKERPPALKKSDHFTIRSLKIKKPIGITEGLFLFCCLVVTPCNGVATLVCFYDSFSIDLVSVLYDDVVKACF